MVAGDVRKWRIPVLGTIASLLVAGLLIGRAQAQAVVTPGVPLTVWSIPSATALDGYGSWVVPGNDPVAGTGQAPPAYEYFLEFDFTNSDSFGSVSLDTFEGRKYASLFISDEEEGRTHEVQVRFPWAAARFYFTYVARLAAGVWGGYVYDATAGTWTTIGVVVVPERLFKLGPESATGVVWTGPDLASCSAFPLADVYRMKPLGFVGQTAMTSSPFQRDVVPGGCPVNVAAGVPTPDFDRYQVGMQGTAPLNAPSLQRSAPLPPEETRRHRK